MYTHMYIYIYIYLYVYVCIYAYICVRLAWHIRRAAQPRVGSRRRRMGATGPRGPRFIALIEHWLPWRDGKVALSGMGAVLGAKHQRACLIAQLHGSSRGFNACSQQPAARQEALQTRLRKVVT